MRLGLFDRVRTKLQFFKSFSGDSRMTNVSVPCEVHKRALVRKITGAGEVDTVIELSNTVEESVLNATVEESVLTAELNESIEDSSIGLWLKSIVADVSETISECDEGDRDNLMFNQEFAKYFIGLLKLYPLWSAICCQFFNGSKLTASSASVESHIKVMKQSLEGVIPCSVDKFVQENMEMIEGMIIEASQDYIKFVSEPNEKSIDVTEDEETNKNDTETIEVHQDDVTDLDVSTAEIHEINCVISACPACKDENWPGEAHKCILCNKNVHILPGCSLSIGDSEGFGEKRVCVLCNSKQQQQQQNMIIEMGHTEKWNRKSKRDVKRSKYMAPVPHWDLNHHFNKNVKIGFLINANMSSRVFSINKSFVGLRNTNTFDSLAQVKTVLASEYVRQFNSFSTLQILAALFAYIPTSRSIMENTGDEIYKISIALAKK